MDENLNNLIKQISSLSEADKKKIFNLLLYQNSAISDKDKETIEFLNTSSEKLTIWMEDSDKLIKKMDDFFNELKKSA